MENQTVTPDRIAHSILQIRAVLKAHERVVDAEVVAVLDDHRDIRLTVVLKRMGGVDPGALNRYVVEQCPNLDLVPKEYIFTECEGLGAIRRLAGSLGRGDVISDLDLSLWIEEEAKRVQ